MAYVQSQSFGTDLVVAQADAASAEAQIIGIQEANAAATKKYNQDMAAYKTALATRNVVLALIAKEASDYKSAMMAYNQQVAQVQGMNSANQSGYNAALAAWQVKKAAYSAALAQRNGYVQGNIAAAAGVFQSGVQAPPDYATFQAQGYCYTQAQLNAYAGQCASQKASVVKGVDLGRLFGFAGTTAPPSCSWAKLPLCQSISVPPDPGPQPSPPPQISLPGPPPAPPPSRAVPPEPVAPSPPNLQDVPTLVVKPGDVKPRSLAVGGLLALVIVGGGALYYVTTHKKKAA